MSDSEAERAYEQYCHTTIVRKINTGGLSFAELRDEDRYYVDKTLLIKDILDVNSNIHLYVRPRRFGKTTNLSMLDAFFNMNYESNTWFDDLAIADYHQFDSYKNGYPVISIDLKISRSDAFDEFIMGIRAAVLESYRDHDYLFSSDSGVADETRYVFETLKTFSTPEVPLKISIRLLSRALRDYHGRGVIILIDEYDRAVSDTFGSESHRPMMDFLGEFLGASLKSNDSLQMAYVTGVMQIAKESIFSGLNNMKVNNVFSDVSDERFGFTESEVKELLDYYGHPEKFGEAKEWYDGYRFGNAEVYNPFSIMNYVQEAFVPQQFWVNSGSDVAIRWLLERTDTIRFSEILSLVEGESIVTRLRPALTYSRLGPNDSLYSLMVMSGYLKAVPAGDGMYSVSIPNKEILKLIVDVAEDMCPIDSSKFTEFVRSVIDGDADRMTRHLKDILSVGSYYNLTTELHYEAVIMTILYGVIPQYDVRSECEEGNGRVDIMMRPRREGTIPIFLELKKADSEDDLERESEAAVRQIHDRRYYMNMHGKVILIGLAFWGKIPRATVETIVLP